MDGGEAQIGCRLFGTPNRPGNQIDNTECIDIMYGHDKGRFTEVVVDLEGRFID